MSIPASTPDSASALAKPANAPSWWQRHGQRVSLAIRLALVVAIAGAAAWWFLLAPVAVVTHTVATGAISAEVMGTGTLEARTSAVVGPKIGGLIVSISVDQGDEVKAGAPLFQLEDSDLRQQVGIAESVVAAATATLDKLTSAQVRAEAVLNRAKTNYQRMKELVEINAVSRQDFDLAVEALSIAEAEVSFSKAAIIEGKGQLDAAGRTLEYQRARLDDTRVQAPFDALVVRRDRDPGEVVTAGTSVLLLVSTDQMWVTAWVDETELARLADGQPARVIFRSEPGVAYDGAVARVGRETDRETREVVMDVHVAKLPVTWAAGQRAEVFVEVDRRAGVTTLPATLLQRRGGVTGVMVDSGGTATWREVTVGLRGRESVEITSGLSPGDVVVSPAEASAGPLRDGRSVRPR